MSLRVEKSEGGKFQLFDDNSLVSESDTICVAFSQDDEFWILHKIGSPQAVESYFSKYVAALKKQHLDGQLGNFVYLELPKDIPVDEINLLLQDPSYLESLITAFK